MTHAFGRTALHNANVLTLDRADTVAAGLLVEDGMIAGVLAPGEAPGNVARRIDLAGATVLPGFIDPHCHPLSLGASMSAIDCSPHLASNLARLKGRIKKAANDSPDGWIRARGYDELLLAEQRHPTAVDLDEAAPGRCVRLSHGSGHADVLSSAAMASLGITRDTSPPPGGSILTDPVNGDPTGVFLEMGNWIQRRLSSPGMSNMEGYGQAASDRLVAAGVTAVTDAGRNNTPERLDLYGSLVAGGLFLPRPTVMLGADAAYPSGDGPAGVRPGPVKIAITFSGGDMYPAFEDLTGLVEPAHRSGRQVAVHAVELEAVVMACEAFSTVGSATEIRASRHRIEHASECPPEIAQMIATAGLSVATQPGFIHDRGDRYLAAWKSGGVDPENLYTARSLIEAGVHVAGSSDAPFGPVEPLTAIQSAVTRIAASGALVGETQRVAIEKALHMYGPEAAWIDKQETITGTMEPGKRADLVVLESDPRLVPPDEIALIPILATLIGGEQVYGELPGY